MSEQNIEIHFRHPRNNSKTLIADVSPHCTGHEALQALLSAEDGEAPFLTQSEGQTYELILGRTRQAITPNMTFAQAGVTSGDTIDIGQDVIGAAVNNAASNGEE